MANELKQKVGEDLLIALKSIDKAVFCIVQQIGGMVYESEVDILLKCKREIKKVLNDHFDELAIRNSEFKGDKLWVCSKNLKSEMDERFSFIKGKEYKEIWFAADKKSLLLENELGQQHKVNDDAYYGKWLKYFKPVIK